MPLLTIRILPIGLMRLRCRSGRYTSDIGIAKTQAYMAVTNQFLKQASILTYINIFQYLATMIAIIIPIVIFTKTIKVTGGVIKDAGH
jgi:hypothetical protein